MSTEIQGTAEIHVTAEFRPDDRPEARADLRAVRAAWARVVKAVPRRPTHATGGLVRLDVAGRRLTFAAAGDRVGATAHCAAEVAAPGVLLLDPHTFEDVLRKAPADGPLAVRRVPGPKGGPPSELELQAGFWALTLPDLDPRPFPATPDPGDAPGWVVPARDLAAALDATWRVADATNQRYALGGVKVEGDASLYPERGAVPGLRLIATDGRRLHAAGLPAARPEPGCPPIPDTRDGYVIPLDACRLIVGLAHAAGDGVVRLILHADRAWAEAEGVATAWARTLEGRFPRWQDVLPAAPRRATVAFEAPADLARPIEHAGCLCTDEATGVVLEVAGGRLVAWAESGAGTATVEPPGGFLRPAGDVAPAACVAGRDFWLDALAALPPGEPFDLRVYGDCPTKDAIELATATRRVFLMPLMAGDGPARYRPKVVRP